MKDTTVLLYAVLALQLFLLTVTAALFLTERKNRRTVIRAKKAMETAAESFLSESRALKDDIEETRRDLAQVKADLTHTVETCVEGLSRNVESSATKEELRFEAMRGSVENIRTVVDRQLEQLRSENSLQLERMRQTVDEKLQQSLDSRLSRSFAAVQESLEQVYKGLGEMQGLAQGVGDLKRVLGNVKKRGILGELQLKAILEQLLAPEQYLENTPVDPSSQERVEFAVRLPGDGNSPVLLPIDAKFPADAYAKVCDAAEAADPQALADARKELYYALKKDAKDIHDKYIRPPYSTDFGILFLPFEGLYAEAVSLGLMEELQSEYQVMLAGPSTMAAMLNSLQMGFKALAIRKNASQVWQVLGNVKAEFDKFAAVLEQTQNKLDQANKDLDKLIGTRTRMIQRSLSQVQSLSGGDPVAIEDELTGLPH